MMIWEEAEFTIWICNIVRFILIFSLSSRSNSDRQKQNKTKPDQLLAKFKVEIEAGDLTVHPVLGGLEVEGSSVRLKHR